MHAIIGNVINRDNAFKELKLIQKKRFVQFLNPDKIPSPEFLDYVYCITKKRFRHKINKSNNFSTEFMLVAAGTRHIDKAIAFIGIKNMTNVMLVSDKPLQNIMKRLCFKHIKRFSKHNHNISLTKNFTREELMLEKSAIELMP